MEAHHIRISVSGSPAGAATARQQIADEIRDWGAFLGSELLHAAELVASELITNAVRHAHEGPITADADLHEKALRIAVVDTSSEIPEICLPDTEGEDGRGLFLVAALSDRHGFERLPSGKRCWAEFEFSAPPPVLATHLPQQRSRLLPAVRIPPVAAEVVAVRPSVPLTGAVTVDGSKNAALPLLAAAAAMHRPVHLSNVPANTDVETMLTLLQQAGWHAARPVSDPHTTVILPSDKPQPDPDPEVAARIRASYYLVPALLGAYGRARLPWPGGCAIGQRGMEQHFKVYERFGDRTTVDDHGYVIEAATGGRGTVSIMLPFRSRGASIAAVLRAVVAGRPLRLGQPNLSPEVLSVVEALKTAGWECRISETVLTLQPPRSVTDDTLAWRVPGDKIEAGTLACAVAVSGGNAHIVGVRSDDVAPLVSALRWLGVPAEAKDGTLAVQAEDAQPTNRPLRAIASLSPGGLDADFEPPLMALALTLPGTHLFSDDINPGRHGNLLPQLVRLGATIDELSSTQCRFAGPQQLTGAGVEATDIRTGSALLIAGLTARGVTTLGGLEQLRRGHADLPVKLHALGADICEVIP